MRSLKIALGRPTFEHAREADASKRPSGVGLRLNDLLLYASRPGHNSGEPGFFVVLSGPYATIRCR